MRVPKVESLYARPMIERPGRFTEATIWQGVGFLDVACWTETHTGHNYFSGFVYFGNFRRKAIPTMIQNKWISENTAVDLGHWHRKQKKTIWTYSHGNTGVTHHTQIHRHPSKVNNKHNTSSSQKMNRYNSNLLTCFKPVVQDLPIYLHLVI